jgi:hypothetical protein
VELADLFRRDSRRKSEAALSVMFGDYSLLRLLNRGDALTPYPLMYVIGARVALRDGATSTTSLPVALRSARGRQVKRRLET